MKIKIIIMRDKKYIVLDEIGNPIARRGDEANPYIFHNLIEVCAFAKNEKKDNEPNREIVSVVELIFIGEVRE